jgi:hypothetical protein
MRTLRTCALGAALLAAPAASAQPADETPVVVGSTVRLEAGSLGRSIRGMVVDIDERSLVVAHQGRPVRVRRDDIARLDVSTGRRGQARKGALVGAAVGAGLFAGVPREEYCSDYYDDGERCPGRAEMIGTGALGGALWGALIGHFVKTERWSPVTADRARIAVAPSRGKGGLGVTLSVAW